MGYLSLYTAPSTYLDLTDVKQHLRVETSTEDTTISNYIAAATDLIEHRGDVCLSVQTWDYKIGTWDYCLLLPRFPVSSVTILYYDANNTQQTLSSSNYTLLQPYRGSGTIEFSQNSTLPATYYRQDSITIRMVCGYSTLPEAAKQAIRLKVGDFYENRQSAPATEAAIDSLIARLRGF